MMRKVVMCWGACVVLVGLAGCIRSQSECVSGLDCRADEVCTTDGVCKVRLGTPDSGTPDSGTPDSSTPDSSTPDVSLDMALDVNPLECAAEELLCDGSCATCPASEFGRGFACDGEACVVSEVCAPNFTGCPLGCCVAPTSGLIQDGLGAEIPIMKGSLSVATSADGVIWTGYVQDDGVLGVSRYDGSSWNSYTTGMNSCDAVTSITVSDDGVPHLAAFCEDITVLSLDDGGAFEVLGIRAGGDVEELEIGFDDVGGVVVAYSENSELGGKLVSVWDMDATATQLLPMSTTHVDLHVERDADIEGQGGVHVAYVADLVANYVRWNPEGGWTTSRSVSAVDSSQGAAMSFEDEALVFVSAPESRDASRVEVHKIPTGITNHQMDEPSMQVLATLEGERVAVLRGLSSASRDVGVIWRSRAGDVRGFAASAPNEWEPLDDVVSCDSLDEDDVNAWSRNGVVHVASRDGAGNACLEVSQ